MSRRSVNLSVPGSISFCLAMFSRQETKACNKDKFRYASIPNSVQFLFSKRHLVQVVECICLLMVSISLSVDIYAQRILTVEEAVATALQNNYDIQLSRNDSIVAALDYSYRNVVFLPTLNGSAGMSRDRKSVV